MVTTAACIKATACDTKGFKAAYKINKDVAVIEKYCEFTSAYFAVSFDFSMALKFHIMAPLTE